MNDISAYCMSPSWQLRPGNCSCGMLSCLCAPPAGESESWICCKGDAAKWTPGKPGRQQEVLRLGSTPIRRARMYRLP